MNYKKLSYKVILSKLDEKFDLSLTFPPGFQMLPKGRILFGYPMRLRRSPRPLWCILFLILLTALYPDYLLFKRDSTLRVNVPGPVNGSYMTTEKAVKPILQITRHNGNYAANSGDCGVWKPISWAALSSCWQNWIFSDSAWWWSTDMCMRQVKTKGISSGRSKPLCTPSNSTTRKKTTN